MKTKSGNIARYVMLIVGILCVVYGAGLYYLGKSIDMLPVWLALGVFFMGLSIKRIHVFLFSRNWVKIIFAVGIAVAVILEIAIIISGDKAMTNKESDYIIVLGAHVDGEIPSPTLQVRLDAAYRYLVEYENSKAILSGGQCELESISEAEAMYRYLSAKGIAEDRLIREDEAQDTFENIRNSFALLENQPDARICVVSSDFHILRAKMLAYKMGKKVYGIGAETELLLAPNSHLREILAIAKDFVIH